MIPSTLYAVQQAVAEVALDMMIRGVRIDYLAMRRLDNQIEFMMGERLEALSKLMGYQLAPTFPRSAPQIKKLFAALGQKPGVSRFTGKETFDDERLWQIACKVPGLKEVCVAIMEYRQLGQMLSNVARMKLCVDKRGRCSWNTAGPETFRWSSSKNAFWTGGNFQNISTGDRSLTGVKLPNGRQIVIPEDDHILWEPDLAGADAQIVAWDSGDERLKQMFREGVKIHAELSRELYGDAAGSDGRNEPYYTFAKKFRHAFHYLSGSRTTSNSIGVSVAEVDRAQKRLREMHPAIPEWHRRVDAQLRGSKVVTNIFGYRIPCFKRPEDELPDMVAWIGQGTIAHAMNRVILNISANVPDAALLINGHDAVLGETHVDKWAVVKPLIREQFMKVVIPYPDPLVIPPDLKTSTQSWGHMQKEAW